MIKFIVSIILILLSLIFFVKPLFKKGGRIFATILFICGFVLLLISSIVVIPAGYTGTYIFLGNVSGKPLKSGLNLLPPYVKVVTFSSRLQELTLAGDESIDARVLNGLMIKTDCTTLYRLNQEKIPEIYSSFATSLDELVKKILLPVVRTEIRNIIGRYTADEVYSIKREEVSKEIQRVLTEKLGEKGIIIDSFLIRAIYLPKEVEEAIQMKLKAQQEAEAMAFKKQKAEEEARIKVIEAKGLAEAQKIINSTLTPYYLQHEAIQAYRELAGSSNTTFVILPTSPNATGVPLIINGIR